MLIHEYSSVTTDTQCLPFVYEVSCFSPAHIFPTTCCWC